ncbi:hypothetical protein ABZU92_20945 [Micromonospora arida]|uniref:hypothetical protein n=1 Tax=Micromonospora arida TaxID=2203715 RepID=UPI0033B5270D
MVVLPTVYAHGEEGQRADGPALQCGTGLGGHLDAGTVGSLAIHPMMAAENILMVVSHDGRGLFDPSAGAKIAGRQRATSKPTPLLAPVTRAVRGTSFIWLLHAGVLSAVGSCSLEEGKLRRVRRRTGRTRRSTGGGVESS